MFLWRQAKAKTLRLNALLKRTCTQLSVKRLFSRCLLVKCVIFTFFFEYEIFLHFSLVYSIDKNIDVNKT